VKEIIKPPEFLSHRQSFGNSRDFAVLGHRIVLHRAFRRTALENASRPQLIVIYGSASSEQ
jgi:hypothetical protein